MAIKKEEIDEIVKKSTIEIADAAEKKIDKNLVEMGSAGKWFSVEDFHYRNQRVYQELVRRHEAAGWIVKYFFDLRDDDEWIILS